MIPKPRKPPSDISSYRPISLLSSLGKTLERVIQQKLLNHSTENSIIPKFQFGFRPKHSVNDALLNILTHISNSINSCQSMATVFLDLERAFDKVWHQGLLSKLIRFNFPQFLIRIIASFLSNRSCCIAEGAAKSSRFTPKSGVPQGSVLSPLLFNIFCSDIPSATGRAMTQQFADDTVAWAAAGTPLEAREHLQRHLEQLESWMRRWRIRPNPDKSKFVIFRPFLTYSRFTFSVRLWGSRVQQAPDALYLGVTFTQYMSWHHEMRACTTQMRARMRLIGRLRGARSSCSRAVQLTTYKAFVRPLVGFRCLVFALMDQSSLQPLLRVERAFCRRLLGLPFDSSSTGLHERAGLEDVLTWLRRLQSRFVDRSLADGRPSCDTLKTGLLGPHGRKKKRPKKIVPFPPAVLLQFASDPLPPEHNAVLINTPAPFK